jgi:hypothetical protein
MNFMLLSIRHFFLIYNLKIQQKSHKLSCFFLSVTFSSFITSKFNKKATYFHASFYLSMLCIFSLITSNFKQISLTSNHVPFNFMHIFTHNLLFQAKNAHFQSCFIQLNFMHIFTHNLHFCLKMFS